MKAWGDRGQGQESKSWDDGIPIIEVDKNGVDVRPIGGIQDVWTYWVIPDAAKFAEEIRDAQRKARRTGRPYTPLRPPPGFPVLAPRFNPHTERWCDYRDPETGELFESKEVLLFADLRRLGVPLTDELVQMEKAANAIIPKGDPKKAARAREHRDAAKQALGLLRFSRYSKFKKRAIVLEQIIDPLFSDFKVKGDKRTAFFAINRTAQRKARGRLRDDMIGIVQRGGVPYTAWIGIERVGSSIQANPFDPAEGCDLNVSKDKNALPQLMWSIQRGDRTALTPEEMKLVFGRYKLSDGKIVGIDRILELKRTEKELGADYMPTKEAKAAHVLLKGYRVLTEAAVKPLNELLAECMISGEELREKLVSKGYYDENGNPRPELIQEEKKESRWSKGADEDDTDLVDDDEDYAEEEEEEDVRPHRRPSTNSKKPAREASRPSSGSNKRPMNRTPDKKPKSGTKRRRSSLLDE